MWRSKAEFVRQAPCGGQRVAHANLIGDPCPVVILHEAIVLKPQVGAISNVPCESRSQSLNRTTIDIVVDTRQGVTVRTTLTVCKVFGVTIPVQFKTSHPQPRGFAKGNIQCTFDALVIKLTSFDIQCSFQAVVIRHGGQKVNGAAGGIASKECTLRATQNLDPFQVEKLDCIKVGNNRNLVQVC